MNTIKGMLEPFYETGTEGVVWSVNDENKTGYDALHCLGRGDHLAIYDLVNPAELVWYGNIDYEYERNKQPFPLNPQYSQQAVFNHWVHGIQKDVEPEQWATWFFKQYPCELIEADLGRFFQVESSIVSSYTYDGRRDYSGKGNHLTGDLCLQFKNGTIYKYKDVPVTIEEDMMNAESLGKYFLTNIKDKFVTEKVEFPKPDWDYIPIMEGGKFPKVQP